MSEVEIAGTPNAFDTRLGRLHGLPGVTSVKDSTIMAVEIPTGVSQTFIVRTYREVLPATNKKGEPIKNKNGEPVTKTSDTIFLQCITKEGTTRLMLPGQVCDAIARQREALTAKSRSKAAKAKAQARKDRGELPGFMKAKR